MLGWFRDRRRRKLVRRGLPAAWREMLDAQVWQYQRLAPAERQALEQWVVVFAAEKHWEGCAGQTITPEVQVAVAGQAALLTLGNPEWFFDATDTILVYPDAYVAPSRTSLGGGGFVLEGEESRAGEAWYRGPVILNWPEVVSGGRSPNEGHNLVIHEFAHQIDMIDDPSADGVPPLPSAAAESRWREVTELEMQRLARACRRGEPTVLDCYGTSAPAEFFSVSSEVFFQRPAGLRVQHPDLYDILVDLYRVDPLQWARQSTGVARP